MVCKVARIGECRGLHKCTKNIHKKHLQHGNVNLVSDRYKQYGTKDHARSGRSTGVTRVCALTCTTPLPSRTDILSSNENKKQLIELICSSIVEDESFNKHHTTKHRLIITGPQEKNLRDYHEEVKRRHDLRNTHEEYTILVQQAML